jgi:hypothetical protein
MKKRNEVVRINYSGGLYGLIAGSTKGKLQAKMDEMNNRGYNFVFAMEDGMNILLLLIRLLILMLTLGIWTLGSSEILVFEKEDN